MKSAIPSDLLKLKARFEAWRKTRAKRSKTFAMPVENGLRLDDQESRAPLTPDSGERDPEEAISWAELRSRMAALINGQLLSEGEILQSQTLMVFESGGENRDEGK